MGALEGPPGCVSVATTWTRMRSPLSPFPAARGRALTRWRRGSPRRSWSTGSRRPRRDPGRRVRSLPRTAPRRSVERRADRWSTTGAVLAGGTGTRAKLADPLCVLLTVVDVLCAVKPVAPAETVTVVERCLGLDGQAVLTARVGGCGDEVVAASTRSARHGRTLDRLTGGSVGHRARDGRVARRQVRADERSAVRTSHDTSGRHSVVGGVRQGAGQVEAAVAGLLR